MAFLHCYRAHRFNKAAQKTVDQANSILTKMRDDGHILSLRQLYYQFVHKNWLPNNLKEYKRLVRLVTRARESGVMDWYAIEDRERTCYGPSPQEDPSIAAKSAQYSLRLDMWADQDHYLEVWVEKKALEGVIQLPCDKLDVAYMACKGYLSASEAWRAGLRFQEALENSKTPILIHLADHDPSGLHMTEDNRSRLHMFAEDRGIEVRRVALNMDQIEKYGPPPNPAKESDSRSKSYVKKFGKNSWELDALEPNVLRSLVTDTINEYRDETKWKKTLRRQKFERKPLAAVGDNWEKIQKYMKKQKMY